MKDDVSLLKLNRGPDLLKAQKFLLIASVVLGASISPNAFAQNANPSVGGISGVMANLANGNNPAAPSAGSKTATLPANAPVAGADVQSGGANALPGVAGPLSETVDNTQKSMVGVVIPAPPAAVKFDN